MARYTKEDYLRDKKARENRDALATIVLPVPLARLVLEALEEMEDRTVPDPRITRAHHAVDAAIREAR